MTRDEAMRAVDGVVAAPWESATSTLVRRLEALGLLKFDEPKTLTDEVFDQCHPDFQGCVTFSSGGLDAAIKRANLKLVRA